MEESWLSALCGQPNEFGWYEELQTPHEPPTTQSATKQALRAASFCHSGYAKAKVGSGIGALAVKKKAATVLLKKKYCLS